MKNYEPITKSEWQIMRVLWGKKYSTSSEIIKSLLSSTDWSPTTVKTFLARLVKKKAIAFDKDGRIHKYYPLLTEMECVKQAFAGVLQKVYGGTLNKETDNFMFYGDNNTKYINLLAKSLEDNFKRISDVLETSMNEKQSVYIYSSQKRLHSALGVDNGPKWLRAGGTWGIIHIAPPLVFDDVSPEKVVVHVLTQLMLVRINNSLPYWLDQGISAYLSNWLSLERVKKEVATNSNFIDILSIKEMSKNYQTFRERGGYEIAYTIPEFIISEYGNSELVKLIKSPNDIENIFKCKETAFWTKWKEFVKGMYL